MAGFDGSFLHVLVVEDSAIIAMDLEQALADIGIARVSLAPGAAEGFAIAAGGDVDAALVGILPGDETGGALVHRLRTDAKPVVLMADFGDEGALRALFPGVPLLFKPFTRADLARMMAQLC